MAEDAFFPGGDVGRQFIVVSKNGGSSQIGYKKIVNQLVGGGAGGVVFC